ncbi:adenylosuccinate synthase [Candidatus Micrarchaeota archaeon]|nr:adenylosuccinate synthase [Candidatus Micrarchaeota archaeon]
MTVSTIIGMQWGDEGKGKIIDILAKDYDYIVRFNGGDNAGHTIKVGNRKFGLHLVPSCIFYPEKFKVIGNGVVINPETLLKEINEVENAGYSLKNLIISEAAHVILQWHKELDGIEDEKGGIGTTKRGIGPSFADKASRNTAIRICDLYNDNLKERIASIAELKIKIISAYGKETKFNDDEILNKLKSFAEKIKPFVRNTSYLLNEAIDKKKKILLEGAQGTLLDIDHGTYPFVTSSNTTTGAACTGSGIPPKKINKVIGITKAYTTRVGSGPFPTELTDDLGEKIRQKGGEFGTTTGRPRRCGWLDLVALKYSAMINGTDELVITKLDVLSELDELKICVAYEIDGKKTEEFPVIEKLKLAKPVYTSFKGWNINEEGWNKIKKNKKMPKELKEYLDFISKETKTKISMISYGPEREETVLL